MLAIRFANAENASKFKSAFDDAVRVVTEVEATNIELTETQSTTEDNVVETKKETPSPENVKSISQDQNTVSSSHESSKDVTEELKQLTVKEK